MESELFCSWSSVLCFYLLSMVDKGWISQIRRRTTDEGKQAFLSSVFCPLSSVVRPQVMRVIRAFGGCLGTRRRRRTWHAAQSHGEPRAGIDPWISEWGNPPSNGDHHLNR